MSFNQQSIVVLPFKNGSSDSDKEFLCDGIAEELITLLSSIQELRVISRKSAFLLKGQNKSAQALNEELGVNFIVEGFVRLNGNKIRINAELIDAQEDFQIWSGKWDRDVDSLFDLEDEIALLISDQIREHVGHFEINEKAIHRQKLDFDVYQKLLQAKFLFYKWSPQDVEKSIELFKEVIEAEPNNIEAHIGLSDAYSFMATTNFMNPMEAWGISLEHTEIAHGLNPNHAGVHYLRSHASFFTKGNFKEALNSAHKAVEINPSYPEALQFLGFFYTLALNQELADFYLQQALRLDPLNQETLFFVGVFDYRFGQYEKAIEQFDELINANPFNLPALVSKSYALIKTGKFEENLKFIESISSDVLIPDERIGLSCVTHTASGNKDEAAKYLAQLQIAAREPYGLQAKNYLYFTYCLMGKTKEALQIARNMMEDQISLILIFFADPIVESITKEDDYKNLFSELYAYNTVTKEEGKQKDSKGFLPDDQTTQDAEKLNTYVSEEEVFLNPKLTLRELAQNIEMHPNQLSFVLNSVFKKNFNSFINDYRVGYFKNLVKDQASANFSLIALAYESGFNSKTVFNTYFKKVEGITPGEFLKNN